MALYIGRLQGFWVHTYSKRLRDKYIPDDYVVIFTLGTGKNGGTKIRGFPEDSKPLSQVEKTGVIGDNIRWQEKEKLLLKVKELK